jgi:chromate reductase, NAD(P)H dehydrogenase (quinone)
MSKIAVIVGSIRRESINRQLAEGLAKLAQPKAQFVFSRIDDLPLFSQDLEPSPPAAVARLKGEIEAADGVLIVTPEYNRSIPGVLKNAIDWASRPYGKNSFNLKPTAALGASGGAVGTAAAQQHLRSILAYLNVALMGQPEGYILFKKDMLDAAGNFTDEGTRKFMQGYVDAFAAWVDRFNGKK